MSGIGKPERETQKRVIRLFHEELGYDFLGDWGDRDTISAEHNSCDMLWSG